MYKTWWNMIQRCHKIHHKDYPYYGARGINVCKRWVSGLDYFIEDMGYRPEGKTLDRIDNERGYFPANCRWATQQEQNKNRRKKYTTTRKGKTHGNYGQTKVSGEQHHAAKLTNKQVDNIRKLYKTGNYKYIDLGFLFNTTPVTVRNIILGKTRKKT
jgi:hypothetical protein